MLRLAAEFKLDPIHIEGTELLDSLVTSVFLLDRNLHVDYLNAAAQTLLGLGPNQALGRSITELTRGAESLLPLFDRARLGGEGIVQRELAWPAPGGVDRILDLRRDASDARAGQFPAPSGNRRHHAASAPDSRERAAGAIGREPIDGASARARNQKTRSAAYAVPRNFWNGNSWTRRCASTRASSSVKQTGSPTCSIPCSGPAARPRSS